MKVTSVEDKKCVSKSTTKKIKIVSQNITLSLITVVPGDADCSTMMKYSSK